AARTRVRGSIRLRAGRGAGREHRAPHPRGVPGQPRAAGAQQDRRGARRARRGRDHRAGPLMRVYVSIGSNIEPEKNVRFAIAALRAAFGELTVSPVYRTAAVGFDGEDFLNLVCRLLLEKKKKLHYI